MKCNAKHLGQVGATLLVVDDGSHGLYKLTRLQELWQTNAICMFIVGVKCQGFMVTKIHVGDD